MTKKSDIPRLETGVRHLDAIFEGGVPVGSAVVLSGPPGSGKTILTQQICFHNASARCPVVYFSTLSEPTAKTLRYLKQFEFFDERKIGRDIHFVDLGVILRSEGLRDASALIMERVKKLKPKIVVIDSFKVFDDLAPSKADLRKFGYEIVVKLMAWETTAFLLGEYAQPAYEQNPLFSIIDGLCLLSQRETAGENQRLFRIVKMRGTPHSRDEHAFEVSTAGVEMYAPKVTIKRQPATGPTVRSKTGIPKLDELLGPGIPLGSSILVGGVAGTGKTVLSLEFLYRGAQAGEKGIFFSFEETEERLRASARGLGWDLDAEIARGMIEIVFIPQPEIMVERHILMIRDRVEAMGAKRVVVDSASVFLHTITNPQVSREKIFHLCTIVHNAHAVGFFTADIPYGSAQVSRFGVEETVVDGVIVLSSLEEGLERQRYIEVYKLRNTAHLKGKHDMVIEAGGVAIFPRYGREPWSEAPPPALSTGRRITSGVPGLDDLMGGGLLERSITLVSGSAGIGKSTLAMQFVLAGAAEDVRGLYVTLEEGPAQLVASAKALGLPLRAAIDGGKIDVLYLAREHVRAGQFLTVLADRLQATGARRVVLDGVAQMRTERIGPDELAHLLYKLSVRFKTLGATSLLTLEAASLHSTESVTEQGLSPVADNLLMLRYAKVAERFDPRLTIVKSRGSTHDRGLHPVRIGKGGMHVGAAAATSPPALRRKRRE